MPTRRFEMERYRTIYFMTLFPGVIQCNESLSIIIPPNIVNMNVMTVTKARKSRRPMLYMVAAGFLSLYAVLRAREAYELEKRIFHVFKKHSAIRDRYN